MRMQRETPVRMSPAKFYRFLGNLMRMTIKEAIEKSRLTPGERADAMQLCRRAAQRLRKKEAANEH